MYHNFLNHLIIGKYINLKIIILNVEPFNIFHTVFFPNINFNFFYSRNTILFCVLFLSCSVRDDEINFTTMRRHTQNNVPKVNKEKSIEISIQPFPIQPILFRDLVGWSLAQLIWAEGGLQSVAGHIETGNWSHTACSQVSGCLNQKWPNCIVKLQSITNMCLVN